MRSVKMSNFSPKARVVVATASPDRSSPSLPSGDPTSPWDRPVWERADRNRGSPAAGRLVVARRCQRCPAIGAAAAATAAAGGERLAAGLDIDDTADSGAVRLGWSALLRPTGDPIGL